VIAARRLFSFRKMNSDCSLRKSKSEPRTGSLTHRKVPASVLGIGPVSDSHSGDRTVTLLRLRPLFTCQTSFPSSLTGPRILAECLMTASPSERKNEKIAATGPP